MILNDIIILNSVCLLWEFSPQYNFLIGTKKKMKHLRCFHHVLHAYKNCYSTSFSPASQAVSVFQITPFYTVQIQPVWRRKNFTWPWTWMKYILTYAHRVYTGIRKYYNYCHKVTFTQSSFGQFVNLIWSWINLHFNIWSLKISTDM